MSILAQMKEDALALGIQPDVKWKYKRDWLFPIREAILRKNAFSYLKAEQLLSKYESPMLCFGYWNLKVEEQDAIWFPDNEWIIEEKFDGCRVFLVNIPNEGWSVFSRDYDPSTYLFKNWTSKIMLPWSMKVQEKAFVLDCELKLPLNSQILRSIGGGGFSKEDAMKSIIEMGVDFSQQYQKDNGVAIIYAFDILSFDGVDLRSHPLKVRKFVLSKVIESLNFQGIDVVGVQGSTFKSLFFDKILSEGGEGVVAKNLNSLYQSSFTRNANWWVKIKDTKQYDIRRGKIVGYITGYGIDNSNSLVVNSIKVSVVLQMESGLEQEVEIAEIATLPQAYKKSITLLTDGKVATLNKDMYGVCVEIEGWDYSTVIKKFRHARLVRFNPRSSKTVILESDLVRYTSI